MVVARERVYMGGLGAGEVGYEWWWDAWVAGRRGWAEQVQSVAWRGLSGVQGLVVEWDVEEESASYSWL